MGKKLIFSIFMRSRVFVCFYKKAVAMTVLFRLFAYGFFHQKEYY